MLRFAKLSRNSKAVWHRGKRRRVVELLQEHLDGELKLDNTCRGMQAFSQPFCAIIQEIVWDLRTSLLDLCIALRSRRSLLSETNSSLVEIAAQTGFSDQAALTRTFANVVGATPGKMEA